MIQCRVLESGTVPNLKVFNFITIGLHNNSVTKKMHTQIRKTAIKCALYYLFIKLISCSE